MSGLYMKVIKTKRKIRTRRKSRATFGKSRATFGKSKATFGKSKATFSKTRKQKGGQNEWLEDYIRENHDKKLMLIIGAIPEQINKFIIPEGYVPVFVEDDPNQTTYFGREKLNKTPGFSEYPLIITTAPHGLPKQSFDLIIFDNGVIKFNPLTKHLITQYQSLLRDEKSVLVLDNIYKSAYLPMNIYLRDKGMDICMVGYNTQKDYCSENTFNLDTKNKLLQYTADIYLNGYKKLKKNDIMHVLAINLWDMFEMPSVIYENDIHIQELLDNPKPLSIMPTHIFHRNQSHHFPYIYITKLT